MRVLGQYDLPSEVKASITPTRAEDWKVEIITLESPATKNFKKKDDT
jgi:hypothetical protein